MTTALTKKIELPNVGRMTRSQYIFTKKDRVFKRWSYDKISIYFESHDEMLLVTSRKKKLRHNFYFKTLLF